MKIISTNIGERKDINWKGKMITTGIFKFPVNASIFLDKEEVKGDTICNRKYQCPSHRMQLRIQVSLALKHRAELELTRTSSICN